MQIATINKVQWLSALLAEQLSEDGLTWMQDKVFALSSEQIAARFTLLFSLVPRQIPPVIPVLPERILAEADVFYPGFVRAKFNLQQLCRLYLTLQLPTGDNLKVLTTVFETADINELVVLYKSLYWLDNAADFVPRFSEGIRTNMVDVLDAIALNNPFAARFLNDDAWNQMVLKAIFNSRPLYQIFRLRDRKNQKLALILDDYIHERWSAGRTISPEIWQLMPGFENQAIIADLQKAAATSGLDQVAAYKALAECGKMPDTTIMTWEEIGKQHNSSKN